MPFLPPKAGLAGLYPFCGIGKGFAYNMMVFAFPFVSMSFPGLIPLAHSASIKFPGQSDPVSVSPTPQPSPAGWIVHQYGPVNSPGRPLYWLWCSGIGEYPHGEPGPL